MMQIIQFLLFLTLLITQPTFSNAEDAKNSNFYLSIEANTPVGFYAKPDPNTKPIFKLPPNSVAIEYVGCRNLGNAKNVYSKYMGSNNKRWCQIIYRDIYGWVQKKYLRPYKLSEQNNKMCQGRLSNDMKTICSNYELMGLKQALLKTQEHAQYRAKLSGNRNKKTELTKSQKLWEGSLANCNGDIYIQIDCLRAAYKSRITYLQAKWLLVSNSKSKQYSCAGQKYTITSFNTPHYPSILVRGAKDQAVMIDYQDDGEILYLADSDRHVAIYGDGLQIKWNNMTKSIMCDEL
jgi:uncharacterized protein